MLQLVIYFIGRFHVHAAVAVVVVSIDSIRFDVVLCDFFRFGFGIRRNE